MFVTLLPPELNHLANDFLDMTLVSMGCARFADLEVYCLEVGVTDLVE